MAFMLSLWFRGLSWAAWWPVSTWLLMMQKVASQPEVGCATGWPVAGKRVPAGGQQSPMADDAAEIIQGTPPTAGGGG
jgi:hypothetical protein